MPHKFDRSGVDMNALAADLAARLGYPVALSAREPQTDGDGVLVVLDPDTGEENVGVPSATVQAAITAAPAADAVPPLTDAEISAVRQLIGGSA